MQENKNNQMRVVKNNQMCVVKNKQMKIVVNNQMHAATPKRKKSIDKAHKKKAHLELIECKENTVLKEFAMILEVTPEQIREENKKPALSEMRYLYFKLRCEMHGITFSAAGRELSRSPATVKYGLKRINELLHQKDKIIVAMWNQVKNIGELL